MDNLFTKIYKSLFITFLMISSASAKSFNSDSTNHVPLRTYKETRVSPSQNNQNQALSCPAPFSLGNIQQRRDVYKARDLDGNEHITGYGPWVETSRNCHRNITQNQTLSCPANQRGTWTQVRNYIEYYNGNVGGDTGWQTNVNTCDYYFIETRYNYTSGACPASYAGSTTLRQSYDYWSDGSSRNVSGWVTSANNCVPAVVEFVTPNEFFNPPRKGRDFGGGQTYGPYTVTSQGITMTLYYNIYSVVQGKRYVCTGQGGDAGNDSCGYEDYGYSASDLTIQFSQPGYVQVYWDRSYSSFSPKNTDSSGKVVWTGIVNSQWTDNRSRFTINLTR